MDRQGVYCTQLWRTFDDEDTRIQSYERDDTENDKEDDVQFKPLTTVYPDSVLQSIHSPVWKHKDSSSNSSSGTILELEEDNDDKSNESDERLAKPPEELLKTDETTSGSDSESSVNTNFSLPFEAQNRKRKLSNYQVPKSTNPFLSDGLEEEPTTSGCPKRIKVNEFFSLPTDDNESCASPASSIKSLPDGLTDWLRQFQDWSHNDKLSAIHELLDVCDPAYVRHMMQIIEPRFQRDFISLLPKELALHVLSYLEPRDLLRAAQTCQYWKGLCDDNILWRARCVQANVDVQAMLAPPSKHHHYYHNRHNHYHHQRHDEHSPVVISSPWKAAFLRHHKIEMNWRVNPIKTLKILKGHDEHVITCLQFCGNRIVSGSDDNTLKVWSVANGKCLRTLVGHTGGVWSSQMSGSLIISGSTDRTLKVWNLDSGNCIHTLYGHTSTVRCMHLHGNTVVSGSRDTTLRVWDVVTGKCLHVLMGHLAAVRCVQYDGRLIVSGAYDYTVKVWDPDTETCLHTLSGHTNRVYSLQFDGVHVVSGSLDTSIKVWDVETGLLKHTLVGHQSLTSGMELRNNILVSGNADSTVKVWDITTGRCLQTLSGCHKHQSAVTCLQFNSRYVITSSDDGTVKLWDVKTGEFIRNLVSLASGGNGGVVWRIRANDTKLICAVGSRNGTEETKLIVLDFDADSPIYEQQQVDTGARPVPVNDRMNNGGVDN